MEHKLLNDNRYSTQQTLLDLYYAIESINRVDIAAESNIGGVVVLMEVHNPMDF
jgi:nitrate reductase NapAB chaperone NapD